MGTRFVFPSLAEPNIRYVVYSGAFDSPCSNKGFSDYISAFDTYNDGEVQHSPEWHPQVDKLLDVLQSLALHLDTLEGDNLSDALSKISRSWPDSKEVLPERIQFAASLQYKDDAKSFHRRYSLGDMKLSTSESKRHDKRYESVETWYDGSFNNTMCILHKYEESRSYLHTIARGQQVVDAIDRYCRSDLAKWLKLDSYSLNAVLTAFQIIDRFVRSWESLRDAKRSAECLRGNLNRREVDAPAEAVA